MAFFNKIEYLLRYSVVMQSPYQVDMGTDQLTAREFQIEKSSDDG